MVRPAVTTHDDATTRVTENTSTSYVPPDVPPHAVGAAKAILVNMAILSMSSSNKASFVTAVVMVLILSQEVAWSRLLPWFAVATAWTIARGWFIRRHLSRPRTDAEIIAAERPFAWLMGGQAATWGALIGVTGFSTSELVITSIAITLGGYVSNGSSIIASTPRVWAISTTLCLTPYLCVLFFGGDRVHQLIGFGTLIFVLASIGSLRNNYRHILGSIALRFENQDLLALLEEEHAKEAAARRLAERANQEKSRFLAAASHDVRQPLHALGHFVDALRERSFDAEAERIVTSIRHAHESLAALHGELMEISRLDSGAVVCRKRDVRVAEIVERLQAEAAPRAAERGLGFRIVARDLVLHVDPEVLLRILRNLVANAIAYTPRGRVLVAIRKRGDHALVQVWDTGIGIDEADHERVFAELYRVDEAGRGTDGGLGLGLAIVRRLARLLGTEVTVRSAPGRGSCFQLPIALAQPE